MTNQRHKGPNVSAAHGSNKNAANKNVNANVDPTIRKRAMAAVANTGKRLEAQSEKLH